MSKTAMESDKYTISKAVSQMYVEMNISPENILLEYALSKIYGKIDKYKSENSLFEKKYNCSYLELKSKQEKMKNKEIFKLDDDINDWQFAYENIIYWEKKLAEIRSND